MGPASLWSEMEASGGGGGSGVVTVDLAETLSLVPGTVPTISAVCVTWPAATSAGVSTYGTAVAQVWTAPGASVVEGHVMAPTLLSVRLMSSGRVPSLASTNV